MQCSVLRQSAADLMELQEERRKVDPETASKIDAFCAELERHAEGECAFTLELDDPSGNSFIESSSFSAEADDLLERSVYERSSQQTQDLGLVPHSQCSIPSVPDGFSERACDVTDDTSDVHHGPGAQGFALSASSVSQTTGDALLQQYSAPEEVMVFPGRCAVCQKETETRMYPTKCDHISPSRRGTVRLAGFLISRR